MRTLWTVTALAALAAAPAFGAEDVLEIEAQPVDEPAGADPAPPAGAPDAGDPADPGPAAGDEATASDAVFWGELAYKPVATAADTARALAILSSGGSARGGDFIADKRTLAAKGVVTDWLEGAAARTPTDKGHLAALVCRALGIKGGLWMRLAGPVPRYALRECVYLDLMAEGATDEHVTGGELAAVIDRAERFRVRHLSKEESE